jgi:hypothetical protein
MPKSYKKPEIITEMCCESSALACAKTPDPPPGSWHFGSAYDTFTGHFGHFLGGTSSIFGSYGVGFGPGGKSQSYQYSGLCGNWVTFNS